jgi:protein-arginine kinase activator protein McsA
MSKPILRSNCDKCRNWFDDLTEKEPSICAECLAQRVTKRAILDEMRHMRKNESNIEEYAAHDAVLEKVAAKINSL